MLLFLSLTIVGCYKLIPIRVIDEFGKPVENVLVIECELSMLTRPYSRIKKTDKNGIVKLKPKPRYEFGKSGYYPIDLTYNKYDFPSTIIINKKFDRWNFVGHNEYDLLLGKKTNVKWQPNDLWEDWFKYIAELSSKGYFTNYPSYPLILPITKTNIQSAIQYIENNQ